MVRVKICGLTNLEDALMAAEAGADALGFVLAPSPRRVTPEQVRAMVASLPPLITTVGVFVDAPLEEVRATLSFCGIGVAQLHGQEPPEYCRQLPRAIKSFRIRDDSFLAELPRYRGVALLLEGYSAQGYGGTGTGFDLELALKAKPFGPLILSGGLNPDNVAQAVRRVRPYGVDVSSGVEARPGKKDPEKVRAFIQTAKGVGC